MKLATAVTFAAILLAVALLGLAQRPSRPEASTGRFRLLSSPFPVAGTQESQTTVFRIDTTTGKTWRFTHAETSGGGALERWVLIAE